MTPALQQDIAPTSEAAVAAERLHFLTSDRPSSRLVRPQIFASWQRSRESRVRADRVELTYTGAPDSDTPMVRSADRVLRRLGEQLDGSPVSIILTDPTGLVVLQHTADAQLARHLDSVMLAPGFDYGEQSVGTNGIGTALESGDAARVFGHEHYAENLEDLACVGVPIHHPVTGRVVGAVDLTCWRRDATFWLETVGRATADNIREAMLADGSPRELELFQAYLKTCRRMTGIVFAVTEDLVMLNDHAREVLHPLDQAALFAEATSEHFGPERRSSVVVQLPTGGEARMYCQQVRVGSRVAGVVVHVKLGEQVKSGRTTGSRPSSPPLPGLVGAAPLWSRASHDVEQAVRVGEWLAVAGEPGTGKTALLRAVQLRRQPAPRLVVVDAAQATANPQWVSEQLRPALLTADSLVIQHVDTLSVPSIRLVANALQDCRTSAGVTPWVAVTLEQLPVSGELADLLRLFPGTVDVPPLRLRLEDLEPLVTFFLNKLGHGGRVECSEASMRLLRRADWPGNVEQLHKLLASVLQQRRAGVIEPQDLPPAIHTVGRRQLSQLESIERDAIVTSLSAAQGNKLRAARALGVSRATIYRKIHEYGIVADHEDLRVSTGR